MIETSTIKIYKSCRILSGKNFIVDNIENYLSTLTSETINSFQLIKHSLELSIVIDKSQTSLEFLSDNDINYVSIQNSTTGAKINYYFVVSKEWRGQSSVKLNLRMDVLNSFRHNNGFVMSDKTRITREHKNRYSVIGSNSVTFETTIHQWNGSFQVSIDHSKGILYAVDLSYAIQSGGGSISLSWRFIDDQSIEILYSGGGSTNPTIKITRVMKYRKTGRKIDLLSEGISPVLYKTEKGDILQNEDNLDWYLVYKNQNAPSDSLVNPVNCFICASEGIKIAYTGGSNFINADVLEDGKFYYVINPSEIEGQGEDYTLRDDSNNDYSTIVTSTGRTAIIFYKQGQRIMIANISAYASDSWDFNFPLTWRETSTLEVVGGGTINSRIANSLVPKHTLVKFSELSSPVTLVLGSPYVIINSISEIDRTDAKLIKIIKLPYSPLTMIKTGDVYDFDRTKYDYDSSENLIKLKDLSTKFNHSFDGILTSDSPFEELVHDYVFNAYQSKDINNESKLFHSDFSYTKFVYDSFSYPLRLELINQDTFDYNDYDKFTITFIVTSTINSKFMFAFSQYTIDGKSNEDYDAILNIARNNEIALFNQQYINYVRNGLNYDIKSKNRAEASSWIMTGLSLVGSIVSFASSGVTGGIGIASGIGLATSTLGSLTSAITSTANNEQSLAFKQNQLQNQATSVSGSDDVDLMSYYSHNRAKLVAYNVSDRMKELLFDLFHYTGYIANYRGIPNVDTRYWFNFLQCEIDFVGNNNLNDDIVQELVTKYGEGVTFFHDHIGALSQPHYWDFDQQYENYETSLIN